MLCLNTFTVHNAYTRQVINVNTGNRLLNSSSILYQHNLHSQIVKMTPKLNEMFTDWRTGFNVDITLCGDGLW